MLQQENCQGKRKIRKNNKPTLQIFALYGKIYSAKIIGLLFLRRVKNEGAKELQCGGLLPVIKG